MFGERRERRLSTKLRVRREIRLKISAIDLVKLERRREEQGNGKRLERMTGENENNLNRVKRQICFRSQPVINFSF